MDPDHSKAQFKIYRSGLAWLRGGRSCRDIALADKLRNICFVQGISSDRIQTIVRSRNSNAFDPINKNKLIYIRSAESILCVDKTRQYYYFSSDLELQKCKETTRKRYVCKQGKPLLSSLVQGECAVRLLQVRKALPSSCKVNFVQLTHTVWTQLSDDKWVYYLSGSDSMTVLCDDWDPVDIPLKGAHKLSLDSTCKGYSKAVLLQPMRSILANNSYKGNNQLIQIKLHTKCCEELDTHLNLSTLNFDLNFRETISRADNLRYAGIEVDDLERRVLKHEWKVKHAVIHDGYSVVFYILIALLCCCYISFNTLYDNQESLSESSKRAQNNFSSGGETRACGFGKCGQYKH